MIIEDLEDYPALLRLSQTLWKNEGTRGAAVMVGAGISRSADLVGNDIAKPPLWIHLHTAMAAELYPANPKRAPGDALRLAEEYRVYFGQNALEDFIRRHIKDSSWDPAALHAALLDLPWSDVLTTNYDTLLERASHGVDRAYEPVTCPADLARTRAPRIVKLHGSIDQGGPFVLAAEDYRTYPQTHGAFVNFARQVFIENDLCLLGFSGDDPNFLAWAGWVRDHLGGSARRIYLIGALNLGAAKRRYLESQNIVPIDLYGAVKAIDGDKRHETATQLFLDTLRALRPTPRHEWEPADCPVTPPPEPVSIEEQADQLRACIALWRRDRETYPGWLICPQDNRRKIRSATANAPLSLTVLKTLAPDEVVDMLAELVWRHATALWPLDPVIAAWIRELADPASTTSASNRQRIELALGLLRYARQTGDIETVEGMSNFVSQIAPEAGDIRAQVAHETALLHCARFDLGAALVLAGDIEGQDPIWALRKAAILAECGKLESAEDLVHAALKDLQRRERLNRASLWIRSRLAYAQFMANGFRRDRLETGKWDDRHRETLCDPWREIDSLRSAIAAEIRKSMRRLQEGSPRFDPGSTVTPTITLGFGNYSSVEPIDELTGLLEAAGVPPRLEMLSLFNDERIDAYTLQEKRDAPWLLNLIRYVSADRDALLDRYLSRLAIATLSPDVTKTVASALLRARDHWTRQLQAPSIAKERSFALNRLQTLLRVLARFAIRFSDDEALKLHLDTLGAIESNVFTSPVLYEPLGPLLRSSYEAIAPERRSLATERGLNLPLSSNPHALNPLGWIGRDEFRLIKPSSRITALIDDWLGRMEPGDDGRDPAFNRLYNMHKAGLLSPAQLSKLSTSLWSRTDSGAPPLPLQRALHPFCLIDIPKPDGSSCRDDLKKRIFSAPEEGTSEQHALSMLYAVRSKALKPTGRQARNLFDRLCTWRAPTVDPAEHPLFALHEQNREYKRHVFALAISEALAPFLAAPDRTEARADALWGFITAQRDNAGLSALVPFLSKFPVWRARLSDRILKGFVAAEGSAIRTSYDAVQRWVVAAPTTKRSLPQSIIERLLTLIEVQSERGMPMLLDTVRLAFIHKVMSADQQARLETALQDLFDVAQYTRVDPQSKLAVDISLIRREAVRLCMAMKQQGSTAPSVEAWIDEARADVLPEVRYAGRDDQV
ncbi:hypothetical protein J2X73_004612 [Novosphingobium sp. 1748]|uniref:SIR2 family NAD-dependent protein deacylase n=1 Tax=Novosphingobium sp. 1748 TaxID=2817760 RepID=UPI0028637AFF|nr:SIR2 family protein [Novosphingobium sp. 1748]MDR6710207.1 hypothetical protein [Novosphingobium sp. 1748]